MNSAAGFRHLHEGQNPFLHSGTAGGCKTYHRQIMFCCVFKKPCDLFPYHRTHAAHHELRVHHEHCTRLTTDSSCTAYHAFHLTRCRTGGLDLIGIAREVQRVFCLDIHFQFLKTAFVTNGFDSRSGIDTVMIAAGRAYHFVLCHRTFCINGFTNGAAYLFFHRRCDTAAFQHIS